MRANDCRVDRSWIGKAAVFAAGGAHCARANRSVGSCLTGVENEIVAFFKFRAVLSLALTAAFLLGLCPLVGSAKSAAKATGSLRQFALNGLLASLVMRRLPWNAGILSLPESSWISRDVTLAELGFPQPIVVGAAETQREVYLPVPANLRIYRPVSAL